MIYQCFNQVKRERGITGSALSEVSGVKHASISTFINGKGDLLVSTFWTLLEGMEELSPGSIQSFCFLLISRSSEATLTDDQIVDQIIALATAWKRLQESKR